MGGADDARDTALNRACGTSVPAAKESQELTRRTRGPSSILRAVLVQSGPLAGWQRQERKLGSGRIYHQWIGPSGLRAASEAEALRIVTGDRRGPRKRVRQGTAAAPETQSGGLRAGKSVRGVQGLRVEGAPGQVEPLARESKARRGARRGGPAHASRAEEGDEPDPALSAALAAPAASNLGPDDGPPLGPPRDEPPCIGAWAAGPDLPNWTRELLQAEDGSRAWAYFNPAGVFVGSREAAMACTLQKELSRHELRKLRGAQQRRECFEELLLGRFSLAQSTWEKFEAGARANGWWKEHWRSAADQFGATARPREQSGSGWARGEYGRFVRSRLTAQEDVASDDEDCQDDEPAPDQAENPEGPSDGPLESSCSKPPAHRERLAAALPVAAPTTPAVPRCGATIGARVAVVDLFCGVGGWSLGLRGAGFPNSFGVDWNGYAVDNYRVNECGLRSLVRKLEMSDLDNWEAAFCKAGLAGPEQTCGLVIVGSPPCQPFSHYGAQRGLQDERDGLRFALELVRRVKPLAFMLENVAALASDTFLEQVGPLFEALSPQYGMSHKQYDCSLFGVPQKRLRVLSLGSRREVGASPALPELRVRALTRERPPAAHDALQEPGLWRGPRPPELRIPEATVHARRERMQNVSEASGVVLPYQPAPTVLTSSLCADAYQRLVSLPVDVGPNELTYGHVRALEPRHLMALQSFPSGFRVRGSRHFQGVVAGNAMPPMLAYAAGRALRRALREARRAGHLSEWGAADARVLQLKAALVSPA